MADAAKQEKIQDLIAKAKESLQRETWFEAERLALKALTMARESSAFDLMAAAVPALLESRQQRLRVALERGKVTIVEEPITEDMQVRRGTFLVQPPNVGADARRLRLIALNNEVPVAVLCREPINRAGMMPVVAISPGSTLRIRIEPPAKVNAPDKAWFLGAFKALGDWAIESMDPTLPLARRIDLLLEHLDALPEHENLHHALEAACQQAHETGVLEKPAPAPRGGMSKPKMKA